MPSPRKGLGRAKAELTGELTEILDLDSLENEDELTHMTPIGEVENCELPEIDLFIDEETEAEEAEAAPAEETTRDDTNESRESEDSTGVGGVEGLERVPSADSLVESEDISPDSTKSRLVH